MPQKKDRKKIKVKINANGIKMSAVSLLPYVSF